MLFITILSGSFLPIFTSHKAEAYLDDNFNIPEVKVISIGATTAVLQFHLQVNGGNDGNIGHDIYKGRIAPNGSTNGITGWTYIEGQDGNPIYEVLSGQSNSSQGNEEIPGNGGALGSYDPLECNGYGCGVYLDIATSTDNLSTIAKKEATTPSDEEVINGKILDRAGKPIPGIAFDQNTGQSIVVIPDLFLGTQTINITVTGLKPNTPYVSQGRLEETCSVIPLIRNCVGELSNDTLSALSDDEEKIASFKTLPAGSPEVTTNPTAGQNTVEGSTDTGNPGNLPYCLDFSLTSGRAAINMLGCFTQLVYYVLYIPTAALARLAAGFLDWFLHFSLQSSSYTATEFVPQGWRIVRDISNILFIFVLLYIAIGTILRLNGVDAKKMIASLVVVALLINFSLFFTKIIIDTSNILARIMYDSVSVTGQSSASTSGEKSITLGLVSKFNPQKIFKTSDIDANENTGWFFFVLLIAIAINIFMFLMFLKVAVLFLGRVIGLMVSMILSPFAFVSWIVPSMKSWMKIGWTNWWSELVAQAFMAPVFLFFLYIIIMATDLKLLPIAASNSPTGGSLESNIQGLIGLIIPFAIIYFLIKTAVDMAVKLSGDIGAASLSVMNKVGGAAVGVATGGVAYAGRRVIGAGAARLAESGALKDAASETGVRGFLARRALNTSVAASNASYDARNISVAGKSFASETGWKVGAVKSGGFIKDKSAQAAKDKAYADSLRAGPREQARATQLQNEERRLGGIGVGNVDPRTGNRVSQTQIDGARQASATATAAITARNNQRRQGAANVTEQGAGLDYIINRLGAAANRATQAPQLGVLNQQLTTAQQALAGQNAALQAEQARLTTLRRTLPANDPAVQNQTQVVTQAQNAVNATLTTIGQAQTDISAIQRGPVDIYNERTANDIRGPATTDPTNQQQVNQATLNSNQQIVATNQAILAAIQGLANSGGGGTASPQQGGTTTIPPNIPPGTPPIVTPPPPNNTPPPPPPNPPNNPPPSGNTPPPNNPPANPPPGTP